VPPQLHEHDRSVAELAHDVILEPLQAVKPRMRGWLHAGASPLVLVAGIILVCLAPTTTSRWAAVVYSVTGVILFGTSALYNVGTWGPRGHAILQRIDHGNIYLIIAGTYTPIVILALDGRTESFFIVGAWAAATMGVLFRVLWISAPRLLYTGLYIALGWAISPFMGDLFAVSVAVGALTLAGGLLYTVGGVVYALKRPDPNPTWFGFHEIFHVFTIGAWACQYIAISVLTYRAA
jgi:hemolysin III